MEVAVIGVTIYDSNHEAWTISYKRFENLLALSCMFLVNDSS